MEQMKTIKASLLGLIQTQLADPKCVDAKELGEVFDMLKDLMEAAYYCSILQRQKARSQAASLLLRLSNKGASAE